MRTKKASATIALHNLEQWIKDGETTRKVSTIAYNIPYGMARGLKSRAEIQRNLPGTYFVISENSKAATT